MNTLESIKSKILLKEEQEQKSLSKILFSLKIYSLDEMVNLNSTRKTIKLPFITRPSLGVYFFRLVLIIVTFFVIIWEFQFYFSKNYFFCFLLLLLFSPILSTWYYMFFFLQKKQRLYVTDKFIRNNDIEYPFDDIINIFILVKYGGRRPSKYLVLYHKNKIWTKLYLPLIGYFNFHKLLNTLYQITNKTA